MTQSLRPTVSLAIIPARGGSKSVPRKNLRQIGGRPMIAWTIAAARGASGIDRVIVSTDDREIADTSAIWCAEVPFFRPAALAADDTPGIDPILHALTWLEANEAFRPDRVVVLQPASPLRTSEDIDAAFAVLDSCAARSVVSVSRAPHHPVWMQRVDAEGRMSAFMSEDIEIAVRQQLKPVYILNGAIYIVRRDALVADKRLYGDDTRAYIMPQERSLDIDTEWDVHLADLILSGAPRGRR